MSLINTHLTTLGTDQEKKSCCFSLSVLFHPFISPALVSLFLQHKFSDYQQYGKVAILRNMSD